LARQTFFPLNKKLQSLGIGAGAEHHLQIIKKVEQVERGLVEGGYIDFGHVQYLVDQSQQVYATGLMKIAIYFSEKLILFLFRLYNEK